MPAVHLGRCGRSMPPMLGAEKRMPMSADEFKTWVNWERNLKPGDKVLRRWTWSNGYYSAPAEVVKVNFASVRVRVLSGYLAGRSVPSPRLWNETGSFRDTGWTPNNCLAPLPAGVPP